MGIGMTRDQKTQKTKLKLEALYKEYDTRTKEIESHSSRYHRNVGYVQTYLAALSSLATYIYISENIKFFEEALKGSHHFEIIGVLSFLTIFLFFLHATMMDTLYMLMSNGSRVGVLEKKINQAIESPAMEWENRVIPFILGVQWWVANGSLRPQPLVFASIFTLFVLAIGSLCFFAWNYAYTYFGYYAVPTVLSAAFFLWQWLQLSMLNGGRYLKNSIHHMFALEEREKWDTDLTRYAIAPVTVVLGFGVFATLSLQTGTFLASDTYPFGLMAIPSIFIGDLLILPLLNRKIYDVVKAYRIGGFSTGRKFRIVIFILSLLSFATMGYAHYLWTQDAYLGFMDMQHGNLTVAGWWHYIFSSVELAAILTAVYMGVVARAHPSHDFSKSFLTFAFWLLAFTTLSLIDFLSSLS